MYKVIDNVSPAVSQCHMMRQPVGGPIGAQAGQCNGFPSLSFFRTGARVWYMYNDMTLTMTLILYR